MSAVLSYEGAPSQDVELPPEETLDVGGVVERTYTLDYYLPHSELAFENDPDVWKPRDGVEWLSAKLQPGAFERYINGEYASQGETSRVAADFVTVESDTYDHANTPQDRRNRGEFLHHATFRVRLRVTHNSLVVLSFILFLIRAAVYAALSLFVVNLLESAPPKIAKSLLPLVLVLALAAALLK